MKTKQGVNLEERLTQAARRNAATNGSRTRKTVSAPATPLVDEYLELKRKHASIASRLAVLEDQLRQDAGPKRTEASRMAGKYIGTVAFQGEEGKVLVTSKNQYTGIGSTEETERELRKQVGQMFDDLFFKTRKFSIHPDAFKIPEFVDAVLPWIGVQIPSSPDNVCVEVKEEFHPTEAYHYGRFMTDELAAIHTKLTGIVVPYKYSSSAKPKE